MNAALIKSNQGVVGAVQDGVWGPRSKAALVEHLKALMPRPHPFPGSDSTSLRRFYGEPGDEDRLVTVEFPYPVFYDGRPVKSFRCHEKLKDSLLRVMADLALLRSKSTLLARSVQNYDGCFNNRNKRGGSTKSLHAWGAAIDFDAAHNDFKANWPHGADMPLEVMQAFARQGWLSAGAFWGYDAMHFQATHP